MERVKNKIEYASIRRIGRLLDVITAISGLAIASLIYIFFSSGSRLSSEDFFYGAAFFALVITVVIVQLLKRKLCGDLPRTFDAILHGLPGEYVKSVSAHASLSDTVSAVSSAKLDYNNNTVTTKYLLAEAELNALQEQINPHFLYNTLESICGLALMQGAPQVAEMTETLAYMFRNSLRKAGTLVTLEEEIASIGHYMTIQQFRFSNKFSFHKHIAEGDEKKILSCILPHFTLQPIVENAIYHGLEMSQGKGEIHLHAELTQKRLLLKISDNGCGIPQQKLNLINDSLGGGLEYASTPDDSPHSGMAMRNINLRIKKTFGDKYGVSLYSTTGVGTDVNIVLPCTWEKNFDPASGGTVG